jgi:hypothetical protein
MPSNLLTSLGTVVLLYLPTLVLDSVSVGDHPPLRFSIGRLLSGFYRVILEFNLILYDSNITGKLIRLSLEFWSNL